MQTESLYMKIAVIGYIILGPFVLSILVLGHFVTSRSEKYENPKYWARPWILTSIICCDLIFLCLYFGDYTCLVSKLSVLSTVAYWITMMLLGFHVLISKYDPYILSGKKQLAVWISLIALSWITGLVFALLTVKQYTPSNFGHGQPDEKTTLGYVDIGAISGHDRLDKTSSPLDALDIDFNTNLLTSEPNFSPYLTVTNSANNITYVSTDMSYEQEDCFDDEHLFQITVSFYMILQTGYLLCAVPIFAPKRILRLITRYIKKCHSPLSPSQNFVRQWVKKQRMSSMLFIELHTVYVALHLACQAEDILGLCKYYYQYVNVFYPTVFALTCFILKDVRNMLLNLCSAGCRLCSRVRSSTQTEPSGHKSVVDSSPRHSLDTSQL